MKTALSFDSMWLHMAQSTIQEVKGEINGLVQDCSNSSALAMELLHSCPKPLK